MQLVLELERLPVVHVTIAVMQVALQRRTGLLLIVTCSLRVVLVKAVAVVPSGAVRLPSPEAHPAEFGAARRVFTQHVVAATVLLDRGTASGAFFRVGDDPVRRFRVILTLLHPLLQVRAQRRVVPVTTTDETELATTLAHNATRFPLINADRILAVWPGTPRHQAIAHNEAICDVLLKTLSNTIIVDQLSHNVVLNQNVAVVAGTQYGLTSVLSHDLVL